MFQPAEAWQPQFDPPLPPFRTYNLKSWFEEFAAALELNGIWLQAFMFELIFDGAERDKRQADFKYCLISVAPLIHNRTTRKHASPSHSQEKVQQKQEQQNNCS
ncbi:hypothetical protein HPB52_012167 [Rhipicephalus sanguineus]|uniref:Uncharacterized protein n=1 Tax=Rhipicephalus sanguineus TaxID=34632 RepID=A0A9D4QDF6_RHISA|nr:hypothetical protein HPB52_012167 [Rhipicephalus sanguineus]